MTSPDWKEPQECVECRKAFDIADLEICDGCDQFVCENCAKLEFALGSWESNSPESFWCSKCWDGRGR